MTPDTEHERTADLLLHNARIATLDPAHPSASAIADGQILAVGSDDAVMRRKGPDTRVADARGRTLVPGLIDSPMHFIRGGLNYNMELRWEGLTSLAEAMRRLREQVQRTRPRSGRASSQASRCSSSPSGAARGRIQPGHAGLSRWCA